MADRAKAPGPVRRAGYADPARDRLVTRFCGALWCAGGPSVLDVAASRLDADVPGPLRLPALVLAAIRADLPFRA